MDLLPEVLIPLVIIGGLVYMFMRQNRERAGNAPLRGEIAARVCFETTLDRASFLGTGGFGGTRGVWIPLRGPKRLIVGTDAFMVSTPQALREFVFRGSESSIAFGQAVNPDDCIMITGRAGRQVQLAITGGNLPDIWQALAGTGAALVLRVVNSESFSGACWNPQLWSTWSSPSSSQTPNPLRVGAGSRLNATYRKLIKPRGCRRESYGDHVPAQRGRGWVFSASRTAALSTDFAACSSQSNGVRPRLSTAFGPAPCSSKTWIV